MPTLQEIAVEACSLLPGEPGKEQLGRSVTLSGVTATTLTSTTGLLFGGLTEQAYAQKWVWRPGAANTTDTVRYSTAYAPDTGVITIVGNYTDTTVGSETAILSMFSPFEWRLAIDQAVRKTRELDTTIIPVIRSQPWHWIQELTWIETPSQIREVGFTNSPVISRNRNLQKRAPNTSGVWTPRDWTVTSNADTTPYEATTYRGQKYFYVLERSGGTDAVLEQTVGNLFNGISGGYPVGETITAVAVVRPETSTNVLLAIDAGNTGSATSSGTAIQELSCTAVLTSSAQDIDISLTSQTQNEANRVYELYLCIGSLTDAIRRDDYPVYTLRKDQYEFEQSGPLKINTPSSYIGSPGSFVIKSERPFPGFDSTRLGTGAADTDSTDAPLTTAATGAIFHLFRGRYGSDAAITREWEKKFDRLRMSHIAAKTDGQGFNMLGSALAAPAGRVR